VPVFLILSKNGNVCKTEGIFHQFYQVKLLIVLMQKMLLDEQSMIKDAAATMSSCIFYVKPI
jgi:hypothetical protein